MEQEVKDAMNAIKDDLPFQERVTARYEEFKHDRAARTHLQQLPTLLENGEAEYRNLEERMDYFTERARFEGDTLVRDRKEFQDLVKSRETVQRELQELKLVKDEGGLDSDKWDAIEFMRSELLQYPAMATALFDTPFLAQLGQRFGDEFTRLTEDVQDIQSEIEQATNKASSQVIRYIDKGDFSRRLKKAFTAMESMQTRNLESLRQYEAELEEDKTRLQKELSELRLGNEAEIDKLSSELEAEKIGRNDEAERADEAETDRDKAIEDAKNAQALLRSLREQMAGRFRAYNTRVLDLEKRLGEFRLARKRAMEEATKLSTDLKRAETSSGWAIKQVKEGKKVRESLSEKHTREVEALNTEVQDLKRRLEQAEENSSEHESRAASSASACADMQKRLEDEKGRTAKVQQEQQEQQMKSATTMRDLQEQLESEKKLADANANTVLELQSELSQEKARTAKAQWQEEADAIAIYDLQQKLENEEKSAVANVATILKLQSELSQEKARAAEAQQKKEEQKERDAAAIQHTRNELEDEKKLAVANADTILKLQLELSQEKARAAEAQQEKKEQKEKDAATIQHAHNELGDEKHRADENGQQLSTLREQKVRDDSSRKELEEESAALQREKDKLWQDFQNLTVEKDDLSAHLAQSKDDAAKAGDNLSTQLQKARDEIAEVEKTLQASRQEAAQASREAKEKDEILEEEARAGLDTLTTVKDQRNEAARQVSILVQTNCIKSKAIIGRPAYELFSILERSTQYTEDISTVDSGRILNSNNSDLPEGTHLIADTILGAFVLLVSDVVCVFDIQDIRQIYIRRFGEITLALEEDSRIPEQMRVLCLAGRNGENKAGKSFVSRFMKAKCQSE